MRYHCSLQTSQKSKSRTCPFVLLLLLSAYLEKGPVIVRRGQLAWLNWFREFNCFVHPQSTVEYLLIEWMHCEKKWKTGKHFIWKWYTFKHVEEFHGIVRLYLKYISWTKLNMSDEWIDLRRIVLNLKLHTALQTEARMNNKWSPLSGIYSTMNTIEFLHSRFIFYHMKNLETL